MSITIIIYPSFHYLDLMTSDLISLTGDFFKGYVVCVLQMFTPYLIYIWNVLFGDNLKSFLHNTAFLSSYLFLYYIVILIYTV